MTDQQDKGALRDKNGLEYRFEDVGQYDFYSDEENLASSTEIKKVRIDIGEVLVVFGGLEHVLEQAVAGLIDERSAHRGLLISKTMSFKAKVDLMSDLSMSLAGIEKDKERQAYIKQIVQNLQTAGQLRNLVAHAKWESMTKDGFVRIKPELDKDTGLMRVKYYKLDKPILKWIAGLLWEFTNELADFVDEGVIDQG